jgi:pimeloyl-ACP methyl ester carboxylesterase
MKLFLLAMTLIVMFAVLGAPTSSYAQTTDPAAAATGDPMQSAFQTIPCPPNVFPPAARVDCGFVTVPENRTHPHGKTIQVAAAVVHAPAAHAKRDPIVFLGGGPSFGAIAPFALNYYFTGASYAQDRDIILVDTRGTGISQPRLGCPEFDQADQSSFYSPPFFQSSYVADFTKAVTACRDRLTAAGIDLSAYNSAESAADLDALRLALGYRQWNVIAFSADGVLGLTYMRLYPRGIRSAIIDSGISPTHRLDLDFMRGQAQELERMFAGCAANPACNATYPKLRDVFFDLVHKLQKHPAMISVPLVPGGPVLVVRVDGAWFSFDAFGGTDPDVIMSELSDIWRSAHGELTQVIQGRFGGLPTFDNNSYVAQGKTMSYTCHDLTAFVTPADRAQATRDLKQYGPVLLDPNNWLYEDASCKIWNVGQADPAQHQPVASTIPTLVLVGEYDAVPPLIVRQIPGTLPNSSFYEFPASGHGQLAGYNPVSSCSRAIAAQFLDVPTAPLDSGCIGSLPQFDFTPGGTLSSKVSQAAPNATMFGLFARGGRTR